MKHAKEVPEHTRLCQDGMPVLKFFDTRTRIGFAWTGEYDDPIEVTHGGFEEPVTNLVWQTVDGRALVPLALKSNDIVEFFGGVCEKWLAHITADIKAKEPLMVKEVW
jgi:hypothetical protein